MFWARNHLLEVFPCIPCEGNFDKYIFLFLLFLCLICSVDDFHKVGCAEEALGEDIRKSINLRTKKLIGKLEVHPLSMVRNGRTIAQ